MYISHVEIKNFRNFKHLKVNLKPYTIVVGANKAGKSNFVEAIKLTLNTKKIILNETDFWTGEGTDKEVNQTIEISVELNLETDDERIGFLKAIDRENIARFTYIFRQRKVELKPDELPLDIAQEDEETTLEQTETRYESLWRMGHRKESVPNGYVEKKLSFEVLEALRDAEGVLNRWRRSPLRPLLHNATMNYDLDTLIQTLVKEASKLRHSEESGIKELITRLNNRGTDMVGSVFSMNSDLDLAMFPRGSDDLLKLIQLYVDGNRPIDRTSLGTQNILFLSLLLEEMHDRQEKHDKRQLILALEEPESHIHPHTQRSVFSYFSNNIDFIKSLIITTHSTHIASVSPIDSIVIIRNYGSENGSLADYIRESFSLDEMDDIQRYLDVTRAELVFARGIIFVERIAEQYLIPAFAKSLEINLDHYGISVIPIHSTNFAPFVKLVAERNLNIPFAVLTDGDPHVKYDHLKGVNRGRRLAEIIKNETGGTDNLEYKDLALVGIFVGQYTIEVDLVSSQSSELVNVFSSFVPDEQRNRDQVVDDFSHLVKNMQTGFYFLNKETVNEFMDEIETRTTKGRFAQRLAKVIENAEEVTCPPYIQECLAYIVEKVKSQSPDDEVNLEELI